MKKVGVADLGHQSSHLLDVFIEDFCNQVKAALRGGAIARYSETTESLNAIRGRLELTDTPLIEAAEKARTVEGIGSQRLEGLRALLLPQCFHRRGCKRDAP